MQNFLFHAVIACIVIGLPLYFLRRKIRTFTLLARLATVIIVVLLGATTSILPLDNLFFRFRTPELAIRYSLMPGDTVLFTVPGDAYTFFVTHGNGGSTKYGAVQRDGDRYLPNSDSSIQNTFVSKTILDYGFLQVILSENRYAENGQIFLVVVQDISPEHLPVTDVSGNPLENYHYYVFEDQSYCYSYVLLNTYDGVEIFAGDHVIFDGTFPPNTHSFLP